MDTATAFDLMQTPAGRANPYPIYSALRRHGSVFRADGPYSRYAAIICGYREADQVLRDPVFEVTDAATMDRSSTAWRQSRALTTLMASMIFANPPVHTRLRRLVGQVFTARRVTKLEPAINRLVDTLLDRLAQLSTAGAPVDFIKDFAFPLPSDVIGELLGVPEEDRAWFRPHVEAIGAVLDLGGATQEVIAAADASTIAVTTYFTELAAKRRIEPHDDLVSSLVRTNAEDDGQLSDAELMGNLVVLFNAGYVTTTHLLGNALALLLERPELLAALRAQPERVPGFVEEALRFDAPVQLLVRWASSDTEVAGFPVAQGEKVLLLLGAANRDPEHYPDPDTFDAYRPDNHPLSFGAGIHYCIGAKLSRIEADIALRKLITRFPTIKTAGPPVLGDQLTLRGFTSFPLLLDEK